MLVLYFAVACLRSSNTVRAKVVGECREVGSDIYLFLRPSGIERVVRHVIVRVTAPHDPPLPPLKFFLIEKEMW